MRKRRTSAVATESLHLPIRESRRGRSRWRLLAQERQHFFNQRIGGEAVFAAQDRNRTMLDELIGPPDSHHRRVNVLTVEMFHNRAAKPIVQYVIFDGDDDFGAAREKFQ